MVEGVFGFSDAFAQKAAEAGLVVVNSGGLLYTPTYAPLPVYQYNAQGESLGQSRGLSGLLGVLIVGLLVVGSYG